MFVIQISITIIIIFLMIVSLPYKVPSNIKNTEIYKIPFLKIGVLIYRIVFLLKKRTDKEVIIKQKLAILNPVNNSDEIMRSFIINRISNVVFFLFIGSLLIEIIMINGYMKPVLTNSGSITRNSYGEGNREVLLDIFVDGVKILENEEINVHERQYTEDEISEKFNEIGEKLEIYILGENSSLDNVYKDLNFVDKLEEYPVEIEWEVSDYSVVSRTGQLQEENLDDNGKIIEITAIMKYNEFQGEHFFNAVVYASPKSEKERLIDKVREKIIEYDKNTATSDEYILPYSLDNLNITYEKSQTNEAIILSIIMVIALIYIYKSQENELNNQIKKREQQMLLDYSQIVSKFALLIGAGLSIRFAFSKLSEDYKKKKKDIGIHYSYETMILVNRQMQGGLSEMEAYIRYGELCHIQKYIKLGALLAQNLKKGSAFLLENLESEAREAFEERKAIARKMGEEAGTKLLLPMGIMLVIVMIIIVIPAFLSFG